MTATGPALADLLERAMREPGMIQAAYSAFHRYSASNQFAAYIECVLRGLEIGPIDTYRGWLAKGRQVQKGSKALTLCMPVTIKTKDDDGNVSSVFTKFIWKANWFVLAQTEGEPYEATVPGWDRARAIDALGVTEVPFSHTDGNVQGYAEGKSFAINPVAGLPAKTMFHELAHIVLGHTTEVLTDGAELTPRDLREVEAEGVALLCVESLGLPGAEACRGYMQHWREDIPEKSARKILATATAILTAGREATR